MGRSQKEDKRLTVLSMAWIIRLSKEAEKQFEKLPKDRERSISEAIEGMQEDPFRGNVIQLKGKECILFP